MISYDSTYFTSSRTELTVVEAYELDVSSCRYYRSIADLGPAMDELNLSK